MKANEKKKYITQLIENGDKRSYNEITADLELELWTLRYKTPEQVKQLKTLKR